MGAHEKRVLKLERLTVSSLREATADAEAIVASFAAEEPTYKQ